MRISTRCLSRVSSALTCASGLPRIAARLRLALLLPVVLATFRPAGSQAGWFFEEQLTTSGIAASSPGAIATDNNGWVHAVWEYGVGGTGQIYYQHWDGLAWSAPLRLTEAGSMLADAPVIATDGDGNLHVVWSDDRDGNPEIYTKSWNGTEWSADQRLTLAAGQATEPRITAAEDGSLHVLESVDRGRRNGIGRGPLEGRPRWRRRDLREALGWSHLVRGCAPLCGTGRIPVSMRGGR